MEFCTLLGIINGSHVMQFQHLMSFSIIYTIIKVQYDICYVEIAVKSSTNLKGSGCSFEQTVRLMSVIHASNLLITYGS